MRFRWNLILQLVENFYIIIYNILYYVLMIFEIVPNEKIFCRRKIFF